MESWMAFFEPPKVSLTTQLSLDLDHAPSARHLDGQLNQPASSIFILWQKHTQNFGHGW